MELYISVERCVSCEGKAVAYCPEVRWSIDNHDQLNVRLLNKMADKVAKVV